MYLPNLIMDILIGLALIIKVCFKGFMKVYAYGILPYILLVSVLNIYSLKKIRIINPIEYFILIFTS